MPNTFSLTLQHALYDSSLCRDALPKSSSDGVTRANYEVFIERIIGTLVPGLTGTEVMDAANADYASHCGEGTKRG